MKINKIVVYMHYNRLSY